MNAWMNPKTDKPAEHAVWLQKLGWVAGIKAKDAKPGMKQYFNQSYDGYIVKSVEHRKSSVYITLVGDFTTRYKADRYVAIQEVA